MNPNSFRLQESWLGCNGVVARLALALAALVAAACFAAAAILRLRAARAERES